MIEIVKPAYAQLQQTRNIGNEFDLSYSSLGYVISKYIVPLGFSVAVIMVSFYFIIGAFELITSQGDKGHIVSARAKIYHSIIGFVLLIAIFLIMQYVPRALGINFSLF